MTTISDIAVNVSGFLNQRGDIVAHLSCNPTRTLTHLLLRFEEDEGFIGQVTALDPADFFARAPSAPLSLDANDNWISDPNRLKNALGEDAFSAFLPVFVQQLFGLVQRIVSPGYDADTFTSGSSLIETDETTQVRLEGRTASIKEVETYFERHHSQASDAVAKLAGRALATLDEVESSLHFDLTGLMRRRELFALRTDLPNERKLSIYAKTPSRLRFEVRRRSGGRYTATELERPADQLVHRLNEERRNALIACDWEEVGEMFTETAEPTIRDALDFLENIAEACRLHNQSGRDVLAALLQNYGLPVLLEDHDRCSLLAELEKRSILQRRTLRRRDVRQGSRRLSLTNEALAVAQAIMRGLHSSHDD